jgi:hypothetical protein
MFINQRNDTNKTNMAIVNYIASQNGRKGKNEEMDK